MPSAADRLPNEIWEQILVDSRCNLTSRDLFRLQRVNRSFHTTINGSTILLRRMDIIHHPVEYTKPRVPNPLLYTSHLEFRPFTYRVECLAPKSPRNGGTHWKIIVHVSLKLPSEAHIANSQTAFGVRSNRRIFGDVIDGSWRRMKLARFPVSVDVPVRVYCLDAYYEEITSRPAEPDGMTLGDLATLLEGVHDRSKEQHLQLASKSVSTETPQDTRVETSPCRVS